VKLTNAIAFSPTGGDRWRIGAEEERVPYAGGKKCIDATRDLVDSVGDPQEAGSQ
jgi:hypothetical protein